MAATVRRRGRALADSARKRSSCDCNSGVNSAPKSSASRNPIVGRVVPAGEYWRTGSTGDLEIWLASMRVRGTNFAQLLAPVPIMRPETAGLMHF